RRRRHPPHRARTTRPPARRHRRPDRPRRDGDGRRRAPRPASRDRLLGPRRDSRSRFRRRDGRHDVRGRLAPVGAARRRPGRRSPHPHQRRAAAVRLHAVGGGLRRALFRRHVLARLRRRGARPRARRVGLARAPLRRRHRRREDRREAAAALVGRPHQDAPGRERAMTDAQGMLSSIAEARRAGASVMRESIARRRIVRTALGYAGLLTLAIVVVHLGARPDVAALALGTAFPGAGFLAWTMPDGSASGLALALCAGSAALFLAALVLWFATGNVVLPGVVWI